MTPAGTSNELDVQNGWEENTHTHSTTPTPLTIQSMDMFLHVLSRMYSSSTLYAQNPALKIVDQQKSVNVYLQIHVQRREFSVEEPFMRSILCH